MFDISLLADNSLKTVESLDALTEFRVTGLVALETCPRRWRAEMLGATHADPKAADRAAKYSKIGTAAHHVIEAYLGGKLDPADEAQWAEVRRFTRTAGMPPEERHNLRHYLSLLAPWREKLRHMEHKVRCADFNALPFAGTLDFVGWDEVDQCWDILDHKTNREFEPAEAWRAKLQPLLYTVLLRRYLLREEASKVGRGYVYAKDFRIRYTIGYVNLGQFVSWMTDPQEDDPTALERFSGLWDEFLVYRRTGEFPARVNAYCGNCPVRANCPAAKAAVEDIAALAGEMVAEETSLLARHEFLSNAAKLTTALLEEVREEIRARMTTTDKEAWEEDGWTASLHRKKTRSVDPLAVFLLAISLFRTGVLTASDLQEVLSVKLTALDKLCVKCPTLATYLVGLIKSEEAEMPTLTVRKMRSRTLQGVDV